MVIQTTIEIITTTDTTKTKIIGTTIDKITIGTIIITYAIFATTIAIIELCFQKFI